MQLGPYTLQNYSLFQDCKDDEVLRFLTCVMPREAHWSKGAVLHQQDHPLTDILLLLDGRLALTRIGASGQEVRAGDLETGALYGQATAFSDDQLEGFSITALTEATTLAFPAEAFYQQCANTCSAHQKVIRNMIRDLARQAKVLTNKVGYLSAGSLRGKIALFLLQEGMDTPAGDPFTLRYNREEMAEALAVARPSLSRALTQMKEEGLIDYDRKVFRILDPTALEVMT